MNRTKASRVFRVLRLAVILTCTWTCGCAGDSAWVRVHNISHGLRLDSDRLYVIADEWEPLGWESQKMGVSHLIEYDLVPGRAQPKSVTLIPRTHLGLSSEWVLSPHADRLVRIASPENVAVADKAYVSAAVELWQREAGAAVAKKVAAWGYSPVFLSPTAWTMLRQNGKSVEAIDLRTLQRIGLDDKALAELFGHAGGEWDSAERGRLTLPFDYTGLTDDLDYGTAFQRAGGILGYFIYDRQTRQECSVPATIQLQPTGEGARVCEVRKVAGQWQYFCLPPIEQEIGPYTITDASGKLLYQSPPIKWKRSSGAGSLDWFPESNCVLEATDITPAGTSFEAQSTFWSYHIWRYGEGVSKWEEGTFDLLDALEQVNGHWRPKKLPAASG